MQFQGYNGQYTQENNHWMDYKKRENFDLTIEKEDAFIFLAGFQTSLGLLSAIVLVALETLESYHCYK